MVFVEILHKFPITVSLIMAAKLKKRAMAEYSQTQTEEETANVRDTIKQKEAKRPRLRLRLLSARSHSRSLQHQTSASSSTTTAQDGSSRTDQFPIDKMSTSREISAALVIFLSRLKNLDGEEVLEVTRKIVEATGRTAALEPTSRAQLFLALRVVLGHAENLEFTCDEVRGAVRDRLEEWVTALAAEKSHKVESAMMAFFSGLQEVKLGLGSGPLHWKLYEAVVDKLKTRNHSIRINALKVMGSALVSSGDNKLTENILSLAGKMTQNISEPRIRCAAFETLLSFSDHGHKLDVGLYDSFCKALDDDFEDVRRAALKLVHIMAKAYPDQKVKVSHNHQQQQGDKPAITREIRLVDDAFGKICNAINDLNVRVRELSAELMGTMGDVSQDFLEQTLDKKLMSCLRLKKSAHDREARLVASGEWSSGKKWADDAPREELDADTINLLSFGACGAFIHGLEDEFLSVRSISVESLTSLSIKNSRLAALALDFLVDMFNDEIELVRIKAIESLRLIAEHITLQVHQLETILSALVSLP